MDNEKLNTPVRNNFLPYGQQWIGTEEIEEVIKVLKADYITQGPKIVEFENKIANYVGVEYAVSFSSGTAALHAACFAAGIQNGDEVITTPLTFAATSNSILYQQGKPVFVDVNKKTFLLDIEQVKEKITSRTKAIIPVDFTGQPVNMELFKEFAKDNGLVFIQDAAHSLGASFNNQKVGKIADMTIFSFHPVKPITTAEGGVVVTNNKGYFEKLLLFRSHGITRDYNLLTNKEEGPWYYEMLALGYNYRMTDIQAALGLAQLSKLDQFIERRRQLAQKYHELLSDLERNELITRPYVQKGALSGWHLYIIQLQLDALRVNRKKIFEALHAMNIGVNVHYIPVYWHPYYKKLGYSKGLCPVAEKLYNSFITLPLFPKMTDQDVEDVVETLHSVLYYFKK